MLREVDWIISIFVAHLQSPHLTINNHASSISDVFSKLSNKVTWNTYFRTFCNPKRHFVLLPPQGQIENLPFHCRDTTKNHFIENCSIGVILFEKLGVRKILYETGNRNSSLVLNSDIEFWIRFPSWRKCVITTESYGLPFTRPFLALACFLSFELALSLIKRCFCFSARTLSLICFFCARIFAKCSARSARFRFEVAFNSCFDFRS